MGIPARVSGSEGVCADSEDDSDKMLNVKKKSMDVTLVGCVEVDSQLRA